MSFEKSSADLTDSTLKSSDKNPDRPKGDNISGYEVKVPCDFHKLSKNDMEVLLAKKGRQEMWNNLLFVGGLAGVLIFVIGVPYLLLKVNNITIQYGYTLPESSYAKEVDYKETWDMYRINSVNYYISPDIPDSQIPELKKELRNFNPLSYGIEYDSDIQVLFTLEGCVDRTLGNLEDGTLYYSPDSKKERIFSSTPNC